MAFGGVKTGAIAALMAASGWPVAAWLCLIALLGAVFGSFLTAVIHRVPRGLPLAAARSRCPACDTPLGPRDLIPVLSFLVRKGKCRVCGAAIGWRYPAVEAVCALLFVLAFLLRDHPAEAGIAGLCAVLLFGLALIDWDHMILPTALIWPLACGLAILAFEPAQAGSSVLGMLAGAGVAGGAALGLRMAFARILGKEALGLGDVRLIAAFGVYLSAADWVGVLILAGLLGVITGIWRRIADGDPEFPFGPALILAFAPALFAPGSYEFMLARLGVLL